MSEHKGRMPTEVKQTQNYFLKHRFAGTNECVRDFELSFQPNIVRIKSVTFSDPSVIPYTLHWEGVGDICSFVGVTDRVFDYSMVLKSQVNGQQRFQLRNVQNLGATDADSLGSDLIVQMEFISG